MRLVWYFDFVSPYSYLQFEAYRELVRTAALRPVLFAGLLNHWGGKGPAATDMLREYLADPTVFDEPEMRRIADLPIGAAREPKPWALSD